MIEADIFFGATWQRKNVCYLRIGSQSVFSILARTMTERLTKGYDLKTQKANCLYIISHSNFKIEAKALYIIIAKENTMISRP